MKSSCFFIVDLRRGHIAVGGTFDVSTYGIEVWSEDRFLQTPVLGDAGGIRVAFEGLRIVQSCLPQAIMAARRSSGRYAFLLMVPRTEPDPGVVIRTDNR